MKFSFLLLLVLLLVAIVGILTQHGHATRVTWWCLAPLGVYVLYGIVGWLISVLRK